MKYCTDLPEQSINIAKQDSSATGKVVLTSHSNLSSLTESMSDVLAEGNFMRNDKERIFIHAFLSEHLSAHAVKVPNRASALFSKSPAATQHRTPHTPHSTHTPHNTTHCTPHSAQHTTCTTHTTHVHFRSFSCCDTVIPAQCAECHSDEFEQAGFNGRATLTL